MLACLLLGGHLRSSVPLPLRDGESLIPWAICVLFGVKSCALIIPRFPVDVLFMPLRFVSETAHLGAAAQRSVRATYTYQTRVCRKPKHRGTFLNH